MTGRAGRVEHHVAELAGQARVPSKRDAVGNDPAADSDLAGDVDDVVAVPGGSAYANGPSRRGLTTCEGRPARSLPLGTCSLINPSEISSFTSAPIVERFRPRRWVSSARVSSPSR